LVTPTGIEPMSPP